MESLQAPCQSVSEKLRDEHWWKNSSKLYQLLNRFLIFWKSKIRVQWSRQAFLKDLCFSSLKNSHRLWTTSVRGVSWSFLPTSDDFFFICLFSNWSEGIIFSKNYCFWRAFLLSWFEIYFTIIWHIKKNSFYKCLALKPISHH